MPKKVKKPFDFVRENIYRQGIHILNSLEDPKQKILEVFRYLQSRHPRRSKDIKYTTFRNRYLNLHGPSIHAHASQQLLLPAEEKALVDWLIFLGNTGHPVTAKQIRFKANLISKKYPTKYWVTAFKFRHRETLSFGRPSGLDPKRARAFNRPTVDDHIAKLKQVIEEHDIPVENIYNMDEKGCQRGGGRKNSGEKAFFARSKRPKYAARSDNLELVTIIETVCADGTSEIKPGFIFAGGTEYEAEWFEVHDDIGVGKSERGWTSDFHCLDWFRDIFVPQVNRRNTSGSPILLIVDGHGSHTSLQMVEIGLEHDIFLFCLPPHTTHKLQPLDVGVFGPFSRAWINKCDEYTSRDGKEMPRAFFVREYMAVREATFLPPTILSAFRRSGCWPVDGSVFCPEDFAPSVPTSTRAHQVPESYPGLSDSESDDSSVEGSEFSDSEEQEADVHEQEPLATFASHPRATGSAACSSSSHGAAPILRAPPPPLSISPDSFYASPRKRKRPERELWMSDEDYISYLENEWDSLYDEARSSRAHAVLAHQQLQEATARLNEKENPRKSRKLVSTSRFLSSGRGKQELVEQTAERERQERIAEEARLRRVEADTERERLRLQVNEKTIFSGAMSSKNKAELQQLATSLQVSYEGTNKDVSQRIMDHFAKEPSLKTDPRYIAIFDRSAARRKDSASAHAEQQAEEFVAPPNAIATTSSSNGPLSSSHPPHVSSLPATLHPQQYPDVIPPSTGPDISVPPSFNRAIPHNAHSYPYIYHLPVYNNNYHPPRF